MIIARQRQTMVFRVKMAENSDKDYDADPKEESEEENTREELIISHYENHYMLIYMISPLWNLVHSCF